MTIRSKSHRYLPILQRKARDTHTRIKVRSTATYYALINCVRRPGDKISGSRSWRTDRAQRDL